MLRSGKSVVVGDPIPEFELPDQHGAVFRSRDALAKGPLVVFFYPKDDTPVCTAEACSFRDNHGDFVAAGATVVGISSDGVESHKRFAARYGLNYPILADADGSVRRRFGVPRGLFGLTEGRVTYVADGAGVVRHRFDATLKSAEHMREALDTVRAIATRA